MLTAALVQPFCKCPSNSPLQMLGIHCICILGQYVHQQLAQLTTGGTAAQGPSRTAAAAAKDSSAQSHSLMMAQLLVSVLSSLPEDVMRSRLAAALLPCIQAGLISSKPAMRKLVIDVASMVGTCTALQPSASPRAVEAAGTAVSVHAAGAAAAIMTAAAFKDKDATVRAKAVASLQGMLPMLWQWCNSVQLGSAQQQNAAGNIIASSPGAAAASNPPDSSALTSNSPTTAVFTSLVPCILDKSKTVRLKAMKLLAAALTFEQQQDPSAHQSTASTPPWQQLVSELAKNSFSSLCKLLEARPDTALHCLDSQEGAKELLQIVPQYLAPADVLRLATEKGQSPSAAQLLLQHLQSRCSVQELYALWVARLAGPDIPVNTAALEQFRSMLKGSAALQQLQQRCFQALCQALSSSDVAAGTQIAGPQEPPSTSTPDPASSPAGIAAPVVAQPSHSSSFMSILQLLYISGGLSSSIADARGEAAILLDVLALMPASTEPQQQQTQQGSAAAAQKAAAAANLTGTVLQPRKEQEGCWATAQMVMLLLRDGIKAHEQQLAGALFFNLHAMLSQLQDASTPILSLMVEVCRFLVAKYSRVVHSVKCLHTPLCCILGLVGAGIPSLHAV